MALQEISVADERFDVFNDASRACKALARRDRALKKALKAIGKPVIRRREGGFEGLFRIIVEQQVSVPSAQAIWARCLGGLDPASPGAVLDAGEDRLKALGLSGPKARYVIGLAKSVNEGALELAGIRNLDDDAAAARLEEIKGIGPWTAAIYLLFCEGRADIWPPKDVALKASFSAAAGYGDPIMQAALDEMAARWAPYRGVAAHILWTYYAHLRGRTPI